ncbi:MAG: hypothetical protein Q8R55_05810 [Candidatus Taylorbacteria bacterium]|nr:hypothetical protein [Candidatus Taylorbacteria bacterium]
MVYAIIALILRLFLAFMLFQTGQRALKGSSRTFTNSVELANAASLLLGLFVYPFTTVLLIMLALRLWKKWQRGSASWRIGIDPILFILLLLLFLKGPGAISLDKLLGNS